MISSRKQADGERSSAAHRLEHFGAVGILLLPDMFIIGNAENHLTELWQPHHVCRWRTGSLRGSASSWRSATGLCRCRPGSLRLASRSSRERSSAIASHPRWGCFPDSNGLALGRGSDGNSYVSGQRRHERRIGHRSPRRPFGNEQAEFHRIPTQTRGQSGDAPGSTPTAPHDQRQAARASRAGSRETPSPLSTSSEPEPWPK